MTSTSRTLEIRTSPHLLSGYSVDTIMFNVVLALLPTSAFAVYAFGWTALATLITALAACALTELFACRLRGEPSTLGDWSVVITGLLYGLTLPPALPLWMVAVGAMVGVGLGKALFGGLGMNPFNPALVGRAFVQAAFPVAMTTWTPAFATDRFTRLADATLTLPLTRPIYDALSSATPLARWKFDRETTELADAALGFVGGSTGETCGVLILLGGAYLATRNMMSWQIPTAILTTVFFFSGALYLLDSEAFPDPLFMLFSGGLLLGAVFMATDMVGSPMTGLGRVVYGVAIGVLTVVIRIWGGLPEGVMYAILLGNAITPLIDGWIQPRVYGTSREVAS
ncbi:MAG: RnfABCDGE type electron transport complex subunit D [Deltaproteobacteria bacterium]|jgi:electron transport complex protein RnfD|nr:RnfABCDGE type electron transport complex subunit D [Deltaproteobacteria bacterium]